MKSFKQYVQQKTNESTQHAEGYQEAAEMMSQLHPEIMRFVASLGIPHKPAGTMWSEQDEEYAIMLGKAIDSTPANAMIQPNQILSLENLANKEGEQQLPNLLSQISGKPDAGQKYIELMQKRDSREGRSRGYGVADLVKKIQTGNYAPPVLIQGSSSLVVVGGRTRLYAALALGVPIKVKILDETIKHKVSTK